jgi:hypothetical protein
MLVFEEILKEKSKVFIKTNQGNFYFDFLNNETDLTIRELNAFKSELKKYENFINLLFEYIRADGLRKIHLGNSLSKMETFWSYLQELYIYDIPAENPKGFIRFCFSNDLYLRQRSLEVYKIVKKNNLFDDDEVIFRLKCMLGTTPLDYSTLVLLSRRQIIDLTKMYNQIDYYKFNKLVSYLTEEKDKDKVFELIQSGKNIESILKILEDIKNKEINKGIKITQQLYGTVIDGIEENNLIIAIPKDMDDLISEGNQQHSCVGYYYNQSISDGNDFIFFIRKKDNPDISYITCRYDIEYKELAEINTWSNQEDYNEEEYNLALKVVDILNKKFKED